MCRALRHPDRTLRGGGETLRALARSPAAQPGLEDGELTQVSRQAQIISKFCEPGLEELCSLSVLSHVYVDVMALIRNENL